MSNVFTITTELNIKNNQMFSEYIFDYLPIFNKIQRIVYYKVRNYYVENKSLRLKDKGIIHSEIKSEYDLTSRAIDSILSNMVGRYKSIKELRILEKKRLERKIENLEAEVQGLKDKRTLQRIELNSSPKDFNYIKFKNLKVKLYWKQNHLNDKKQKLNNLLDEIATGKYKICFGTKKLLNTDYNSFAKQRDSEIYYLGRAGDTACNNNFQVKYDYKTNQFYFNARKELFIKSNKFVFGKFYIKNVNQAKIIRNLLRTKESALTYRIKARNNRVFLQVIYNFEHNKDLCITRNSYGTIGVDFNKGFVSVSETDKYGNMVNTFNINYKFSSGKKTEQDFQNIATILKDYCLDKGKDLVIENLDFRVKKDKLISRKGVKYNSMLSSFAYSKFDKIITSKCIRNRIFLNKVNPAWTSWIANNKYCQTRSWNIHTGASYVIARRGMSFKD